MRVIAGRFRRRQLKSLPGKATRPMLDRLRETLFNVLQDQIAGQVFADLYAGTGAVGIEALSRGAAQAIFVDKSAAAADVIRENLRALGAEEQARILVSPVDTALKHLAADIFFLGPPYELVEEYEKTLAALGRSGPPLVIAQHPKNHPLAERYGRLTRYRTISAGSNALSFFRAEAEG